MGLAQVNGKVDMEVLRELEEKFEKKLKIIQRDLIIKEKKIERMGKTVNAQSDGGHEENSSSRKNLHDKKRSVDIGSYKQNMLVPKLPFMKQGDRISKFGAGYSKLLNRSPPMSPVPQHNQMMNPSGLMSPHS